MKKLVGHMRDPAVEFDWNYMEPITEDMMGSSPRELFPRGTVTSRFSSDTLSAASAKLSGVRIHETIRGIDWAVDPAFSRARLNSPEVLADGRGLTTDEWRWAVAFRKVLGVGSVFYEDIPAEKRREIEQSTLRATHGKSGKSRRARRIITLRAIAALEEAKPRSMGWDMEREEINKLLSSTFDANRLTQNYFSQGYFSQMSKSDIGRENMTGKMAARALFDGIHPVTQSIPRVKHEQPRNLDDTGRQASRNQVDAESAPGPLGEHGNAEKWGPV